MPDTCLETPDPETHVHAKNSEGKKTTTLILTNVWARCETESE